MQFTPRWYEHWTSNLVYDGDMIVLQGQEKVFLSASKESSADVNQQYTKLTFTPTQADRFVLAFRAWLRKFGNSQPDWYGSPNQEALPSTVLSKREVKVLSVTTPDYIFLWLCMFIWLALVLISCELSVDSMKHSSFSLRGIPGYFWNGKLQCPCVSHHGFYSPFLWLQIMFCMGPFSLDFF